MWHKWGRRGTCIGYWLERQREPYYPELIVVLLQKKPITKFNTEILKYQIVI
jgi:hypothetical protein